MRETLRESGFRHHLDDAAIQRILNEDSRDRRHSSRDGINKKPWTPMKEQTGNKKCEDVVVEFEDDTRSLIRDFEHQISNSKERNEERQHGAVFQPFARF